MNHTIKGTVAMEEIASRIDLDVSLSVTHVGAYTVVEFSGPDEEVLEAFLSNEYPRGYLFKDIVPGKYKGLLVDVGKVGYGVYCDIGAERDVLLDLHGLRDVFGSKDSTRHIIFNHGLIDGLCVDIEITRVDRGTDKLWGVLSKEWVAKHLTKGTLLAACITRDDLMSAIMKSPFRDTVTVESLCKTSHKIVCSGITEPPGVVAYLGRMLHTARFGIVGEA